MCLRQLANLGQSALLIISAVAAHVHRVADSGKGGIVEELSWIIRFRVADSGIVVVYSQ